MYHPFLSWWEALLTRLLIRSPRIGNIAIREYGTSTHWVLYNSTDPFLSEPSPPPEEPEPASMLLERLYHAPDATK
jgi:hypothetical protein